MKTGRIKWYNEERGFGFFILEDNSEIFFHIKDGKPFIDDGSDKPQFNASWSAIVKAPNYYDDDGYGIGAIVYFNTTTGRGDRPKACPWGYAVDFERVSFDIKKRKEEDARRETERLQCNPNFGAFEKRVYLDGREEAFRLIFTGTKTEFLLCYPLSTQYDPLMSTSFRADIMRYERWFEREMADGWIKCEDPRTTKLQLTFDQACVLLSGADFDCLKDNAFGDAEFGWRMNGERVAEGYYSGRHDYQVWISETAKYAATEFKGKQAEALYNAGGKTNHFERNDAGDPRKW